MKTAALQQFTTPNAFPLLEIRATSNSTLPYAAHFHSSFSLGLILKGQTRFSVGKEHYLAQSGDLVLIAPGLAHSCNPVGGPRSYLMVHLDADWFHGHRDVLPGQTHRLLVSKPLITDQEFFTRAYNLLEAGQVEFSDELTGLLLDMQARHQCFAPTTEPEQSAAHLPLSVTAPRADNEVTPRPMPAKMPDWSLTGEHSINKLARRAGLCRESFSRSFHRATGMAPSNYLHCLRLEYGRQLLQEGCSIAQAAAATGYVDQSHFHRMFLKYCSVTPGCYRKNRSHLYKK